METICEKTELTQAHTGNMEDQILVVFDRAREGLSTRCMCVTTRILWESCEK